MFPSGAHTNRFRLIIEVSTPEGVKSGSSVIETTTWASGNWGPIEARGLRSTARGQAVFVDLGRGRNLIAVLGFGPYGDDMEMIYDLMRAALAPGKRVSWKDEPKLKGRNFLPADHVPGLITFGDLDDPSTARLVRPDEFEKVFGEGVRFRGAIIETTDAPVTTGLEKKLPWWSAPGRPAAVAKRAWLAGHNTGHSIEPESLFVRRR